jgi:alpha-glucoside transport system permease protein
MSGLTLVRAERGLGGRIADFLSKGVVNVVLVIVAVFWLVPTVGLFLASLRSSTDNSETGWWTVFSKPAELTVQNYANLLGNAQFMGSFVNTISITVPATALVVIIGSLAGYAFARIRFPGRDWLLVVVIVLLAVPL